MPAKSKEQYKFMKAVAAGYIKKPGLSKKRAIEFLKGMTKKKVQKLPKRVQNKKKK